MPKTKTIHVKIPPDLVPFIESEQKLAGNCAAGAVVRRIITKERDHVKFLEGHSGPENAMDGWRSIKKIAERAQSKKGGAK